MVNERIYSLQRLTEGSLKEWQPHEDGFIPKQRYHPASPVLTREEYEKSRETKTEKAE